MGTDPSPGEAQAGFGLLWESGFHSWTVGGKSRPEHQVTGFTLLVPSDHLILSSPSLPLGCVVICKTLHALPLHLTVYKSSKLRMEQGFELTHPELCGSRVRLSHVTKLQPAVSPCTS